MFVKMMLQALREVVPARTGVTLGWQAGRFGLELVGWAQWG